MDLLEREVQWKRINDTISNVLGGEGAIVLVSGEAGIGKTAFVRAFTDNVRSSMELMWGSCDPLYTPRALGPLYDIAIGKLSFLRDLLGSGADWLTIAAELNKSLRESPAPGILVFEDIHWADQATLDLIRYLGRRIHQTQTLLILTYRDDELGSRQHLLPILGDLPSHFTTRISLEPLSEEAVGILALRVNRPVSGIFNVTKGNPFFVTEVLRNTAADIPVTIRDAVLARLDHLPHPARDLLELLSIIPGEVELQLLEKLLHPSSEMVDITIESGFLVPSGDLLEFNHELVRLAIEESIPMAHKKELHRSVLQALKDRPAGEVAPARLVHHAMAAGDAGMVLEFGPQAAEQASRHGAHREAARFYQAALLYKNSLKPDRQATLLDRLSFEYYLTGRIDAAIQVRLEATELWKLGEQPIRVGEDLRWLSRLYWFQGNKEKAEFYAGEAISTLEPLDAGKELAMAYSNRSQLYMLAEANSAAITWGERALELAEQMHEPEIVIHALTNIGTARLLDKEEDGESSLERALAMALERDLHDDIARCYANLAACAIQDKKYRLAEQYLEAGLAYTINHDMDSYSVYLLGWQVRWNFEQGYWAKAELDAEAMLNLHPGSAVIALPGITALGHLKARQGDPEALKWLDQARDLALATGEFQRIGPMAVARAEAAWWMDQPGQVLVELEAVKRIISNIRDDFQLNAILYWTWRAGGKLPSDSKLVSPYLEMTNGDWRGAAEAWEKLGCPFERGLALAEGDQEAQRTALSIFETLGAQPAVRKLREKMVERGIRKIPRGARITTRANPDGLTNREMDILALLGQGLSNDEIAGELVISPKTVDHHVSAILLKMQVHSRLEAAAAARQRKII